MKTLYSAAVTSSTGTIQGKLETIVHSAIWWDEAIAEAVLSALMHALQAGKVMNTTMRQAYDKVVAEAKKIEGFATDHPILVAVFVTIVALGILYLLWPAVLAALGFGEEGIALGTLFWSDVAPRRWRFC